MPARAGRWQRICQSNDPNRVFQEPFFEIEPPFAPTRRAIPYSLDVGGWTLNVGRSAFQAFAVLPARFFPNAPIWFRLFAPTRRAILSSLDVGGWTLNV